MGCLTGSGTSRARQGDATAVAADIARVQGKAHGLEPQARGRADVGGGVDGGGRDGRLRRGAGQLDDAGGAG